MKKSLLLVAAMGLLSTSVLAKEIKFATEATYAPFEYLDDKNEFQGFDIDLARAVCEQAKLECSFHNQAFDSLIPSLKFRRYDAVIAAMDDPGAGRPGRLLRHLLRELGGLRGQEGCLQRA